MPYLAIDEFRNGLDARKSPLTAPAGSLTRLINAAVTPGGEIQKRRAFVKVADLTGTVGLAAVGTKVVAFSPGVDKTPPDMGMKMAQLEFHTLPTNSQTLQQTDFDVFDGNIYVVFNDPSPSPPKATITDATRPEGVRTGAVYFATTPNKFQKWTGRVWVLWKENFQTPYEPGGVEGRVFRHTLANRHYRFTGGQWQEMVPKVVSDTAPDVTKCKDGETFRTATTSVTFICKKGAWVELVPDAAGEDLPPIPKEGDIYLNTTSKLRFLYKGGAWVEWKPDATVADFPTGVPDKSVYYDATTQKTYVWQTKEWLEWEVGPADNAPHYYDKYDEDTKKHNYVSSEGSGRGLYVRAYQKKMYTVGNKLISFSALQQPTLWDDISNIPPSGAEPVSVLPVQGVEGEFVIIAAKKKCYTWTTDATSNLANWVASDPSADDLQWIEEHTQRTGSGFINSSLEESGGVGLVGIEIYFDKIAVMSAETTQIWSMDADPNQNAISQVLRANGTRAPLSVNGYGSGDVLYLANSGLRSLKARDASNSASVTDIGSPIDNLILQIGKERGMTYLSNCMSVDEPVTGRFWAAFPKEIFVLSHFPGPKISAWSKYIVDFDIDHIVTAGDHLFIRSGNDLYALGGKTGAEYDSCPVEVRFPYLDSGKPGHMKTFEAIDCTVEGEWRAAVSYNFDDQEAEEDLGVFKPLVGKDPISASSWNKGRFGMQGYASHISMRFYNNSPGPATMANAAIHYRIADDEA